MRSVVVVHRGLEQLAPELRESLVEDVADLEAAARVDGLAADEEVGGNLLGLEHPDDLVVPAHEELGVLGLLHQEGGEVGDPVEAAERVRRGDHRHQLVGDGLLAGEEADGDAEQAFALTVVDALPVLDVLAEIEVVDVPDPVNRELVLAVDGALDHVAREVEAADDVRVRGAVRTVDGLGLGHLPPSSVISVEASTITSSSSNPSWASAMWA